MKQKVQHYDIQRPKLMFIFYIVSLILLSVSFVLMPIGVMALENGKIVTLLAGITFWLGLLGTIITAVLITILNHRERDFVDSQQEHKKMGVICFFQNLPAKIFDILMFVSLVCGIISCFFVRYKIKCFTVL